MHGGAPGAVSSNLLIRADGSEEVLPSMFSTTIEAGDVFVHRTAGGGGWGDPALREPDRRAADRRGREGDVIDPVTFEVIRNALVAATDEMALALKRSAYSTNIKTRSDFSCAVFDAELRAVAQGFNQPVHLGSMVEQVPRAVRDYGAERLGPGDVLVTNEPFPSGVHLNDVSLVSPVWHEGELLGYVANLAHHVDVGGGLPRRSGRSARCSRRA